MRSAKYVDKEDLDDDALSDNDGLDGFVVDDDVSEEYFRNA